MDMNDYSLELIVRARMAEIRADAERLRRLKAVRPGPGPLRAALGHALLWTSHALLRVAIRFLRAARPLPGRVARS